MDNINAGTEGINFDIWNDDDFQRWVQPVMTHILLYGKIPNPPQDPVMRVIFQQVMERTIRGSFNTILQYLTNPTSLLILAMIRAVDERKAAFERIRETWPETVTHGLVLQGWFDPGQLAAARTAGQRMRDVAATQASTQAFRPLQTYYMQVAARNEASLNEALEDFERLTLQEVQSQHPDLDVDVFERLTLQEVQSQHPGVDAESAVATVGNEAEQQPASDPWDDIY